MSKEKRPVVPVLLLPVLILLLVLPTPLVSWIIPPYRASPTVSWPLRRLTYVATTATTAVRPWQKAVSSLVLPVVFSSSSSHEESSSNSINNSINNNVSPVAQIPVVVVPRVVDWDDLQAMDVVIYSQRNDPLEQRYLGAVQDNGRITPLCVWTTEPAYGESLEFLVDPDHDDVDTETAVEQIQIHTVVPETALYYGSRQVGGGMGPDNPHGELSELLYYIDRSVLNDDHLVTIKVKPELEVFW